MIPHSHHHHYFPSPRHLISCLYIMSIFMHFILVLLSLGLRGVA